MIQKLFFNNYLLMLPVISWAVAQLLKTLLTLAMTRKFEPERLVGSGGMPSSHSALVCSLFVGTAKKYGASSPYFAITLVLAMIVMYDAMGVRLETGKQAKLLNRIIDDLREEGQDIGYDKKLKELVGHTPFQVLSGALLGILIAILIPVF
ncbi:divergent PAP2 family protein [Ruminococcaceae bacterium OttesenSCG-928-D13]|nr:divergent PAP2 family protein [Ruminococcaceae bacterium OttesenSCG-928-D13]